MNTKSIAILGCTGHVGKNLIFNFQKEKNFDLFLFYIPCAFCDYSNLNFISFTLDG